MDVRPCAGGKSQEPCNQRQSPFSFCTLDPMPSHQSNNPHMTFDMHDMCCTTFNRGSACVSGVLSLHLMCAAQCTYRRASVVVSTSQACRAHDMHLDTIQSIMACQVALQRHCLMHSYVVHVVLAAPDEPFTAAAPHPGSVRAPVSTSHTPPRLHTHSRTAET